jgi:peptidoglycan-N-acetylglucosamine deacetylase
MSLLGSKKFIWFTAIALVILLLTGSCSSTIKSNAQNKPNATVEQVFTPTPVITPPADGAKSDVVSYIYTTKRAFALTFSGMADQQTMETILNELDKYNMKALFYLQGIQVAESPDIAQEVLRRGHEIGNDELDVVDLTKMKYSDIYNQIKKANQVLLDQTGSTPKYLWNQGGKYNDDILMAARANGLTCVKYTINLEGLKGKTNEQIQSYLENKITRGGVIALTTDDVNFDLRCIDLIAKVETEMGYSVEPLDYLLDNTYQRQPLQDIPGWDAVKVNPNYQNTPYQIVMNGTPNKKIVVLSFDDWGGDWSITRLLDILDKYQVKASFYLVGEGVEANPNIAMAIAQDGMDIGNHSYTHPDFTKLTPGEMQEEIVKCYQTVTEAIQKPPSLLFRPPYGLANVEAAQAVAATGYKDIAMYSLSADDWDVADNHDTAYITNYIEQNVKNGSVVLFHLMIQLDTYKALPTIIEFLQKNGYTFMTMSELISSGDAVSKTDVSVFSNSE